MQFTEGMPVYSPNGKKLGKVKRVVLDPQSREVTHIIVDQGSLLSSDSRVIPMEVVEMSTSDRVMLRADIDDLGDFQPFQEDYYVSVGDVRADEPTRPAGYAEPMYWYPPVGNYYGYNSGYPSYPYISKTERNLPKGSAALKEGAVVKSRTGKNVGDVERVFVDNDSGQATHFVIAKGTLFTEEKLIPATWIETISDEHIELTVSEDFLEELPEFKG